MPFWKRKVLPRSKEVPVSPNVKEEPRQADYEAFVHNLPFFHGLLSSEDVPFVLLKHGDWLVRIKRPKGNFIATNDCLTVTVLICTEDKRSKSKHFLDFEINEERGGVCTLGVLNQKFDSLPKLFHAISQPEFTLEVNVWDTVVTVKFLKMVRKCCFELAHSQIVKIQELGSGAYGEVHLAEIHYKNRPKRCVALKMASHGYSLFTKLMSESFKGANKMILDDDNIGPEIIAEVLQEARLMRSLRHPNIVRLCGIAVAERPVYVALEFVSGGGLDSFLSRHADILPQMTRTKFALAAAYGLGYLHSKGIIHRDVAARNCLYHEKHLVKISDFGLSRKLEMYKMAQPRKMPVKWMAPESIALYEFTKASDVFSFGNLVFEIYSSLEPHFDKTTGEARSQILKGELIKFDNTFPIFVHALRPAFWAFNRADRPSMSNIIRVFTIGLRQIRAAQRRAQEDEKRGVSTTVARKKRGQQKLEDVPELTPVTFIKERFDFAAKLTPLQLANEKKKRRDECNADDMVGPMEVDRRYDVSCSRPRAKSASRARRMRRRASHAQASRRKADVVVEERPRRRASHQPSAKGPEQQELRRRNSKVPSGRQE